MPTERRGFPRRARGVLGVGVPGAGLGREVHAGFRRDAARLHGSEHAGRPMSAIPPLRIGSAWFCFSLLPLFGAA